MEAVPLPWCYATHNCWVFECCVFLLLSLPLETFSALYEFCSNFFHAIVKLLCVYHAGAMLAALYPNTHFQWLQKGGKSRYSNDRSTIPLQAVLLPRCYATHVCRLFEGCVFLLLSLALETFYEFCSNFSHANVRPLCFYSCPLVLLNTLAMFAEGWQITLFQ